MTWRRWNWLDDGILPLLIVAVRVCWLWPWLNNLQRWLTPDYPQAWLPLWTLPALFLGGTWLTRTVMARTPRLSVARIWVAGGGLVVIVVLLWQLFARDPYALEDGRGLYQLGRAMTDWRFGPPPMLMALFVAAGIWLRGVMDGVRRHTRDDVWGVSVTAYGAFALLALVAQMDPQGLPPQTNLWLLALIATSLSALALSSLELARSINVWGDEISAKPELSRDWLLGVLVVIAAVLVVGLALAAIFTPSLVAQALGWVTVVLRWLGMLVGYVALAVAYVIFFFLTPLIEWLRSRMADSEPQEPQEEMGFAEQFEEIITQPPAELSPMAQETLRWLGLVGLLIVLAVVFALALRYFRLERAKEADETRETILTRDLLQEQLASLWRNWMARFRRRAGDVVDPFLSLAGETELRRAIRAAYQALLSMTEHLGHPRRRGQTPAEYARQLTGAWPAEGDAWHAITAAYLDARYGAREPTPDQVEQVRRAWTAAKAALRAQAEAAAETTSESAEDAGVGAADPSNRGG